MATTASPGGSVGVRQKINHSTKYSRYTRKDNLPFNATIADQQYSNPLPYTSGWTGTPTTREFEWTDLLVDPTFRHTDSVHSRAFLLVHGVKNVTRRVMLRYGCTKYFPEVGIFRSPLPHAKCVRVRQDYYAHVLGIIPNEFPRGMP